MIDDENCDTVKDESGLSMHNALAKLANAYQHPGIKALIALITGLPGGTFIGAIDAGLQATIERMRDERLRVFFDELSNGRIELTTDLIQNEDFLHRYFTTVNAALRSRRHEKVRLFARLLKSSADAAAAPHNDDEYEELLKILDALSVDDWHILLHAEKLQLQQGDGHRLIAGEFLGLGIPGEMLSSRISRIATTGCLMELTDAPTAWHEGKWDNHYSRFIHLTPLYFRLKKLVTNETGNIL